MRSLGQMRDEELLRRYDHSRVYPGLTPSSEQEGLRHEILRRMAQSSAASGRLREADPLCTCDRGPRTCVVHGRRP